MPLTNQAKDNLGDHMFLNTAAIHYGDNAGLLAAAAPGSTELSLAIGAGYAATDTTMITNEVAYTGYARPTSPRSGTGYTSVDGAIANAQIELFGEMTAGGPQTVTEFGMTFNIITANYLQWYGALDSSLIINNNVEPQFAVGALDLTIT